MHQLDRCNYHETPYISSVYHATLSSTNGTRANSLDAQEPGERLIRQVREEKENRHLEEGSRMIQCLVYGTRWPQP